MSQRSLWVSGAVFVALLAGHDPLHASAWGWLEWPLALVGWFAAGRETLGNAWANLRRGDFLDENFLMGLATVGAFALHQLPEAVGVMLFYGVGEHLQNRAVERSRRSIRSLLDLRPATAHRLSASGVETVAPEALKPGETVVVRPGERVPVDGLCLAGEGWFDTSSLTGESEPRRVGPGDEVASGFLARDGRVELRTLRPSQDSAAARILEMVENARSRKARTERFITAFARWYTPLVVAGASLLAAVPAVLGWTPWEESLRRALVFLVASCPCALLISVPLGYLAGIGAASRKGLLVKGAEYLDRLAKARTVVFDKTGTLTRGRFALESIEPVPGVSSEALLACAAALEETSNHPLARAVVEAARARGLAWPAPGTTQERRGEGIVGELEGTQAAAGNRRLMAAVGVDVATLPPPQGPQAEILVAREGRLLGALRVGDQPREDARATLAELRRLGIKHLEILSGDHAAAVEATASEFGVPGRGDLRPEDKLARIEALEAAPGGSPVVFVGDGLNDAPVLARADVGVAVGGHGNDAALEVADLALLHGRLGALADGVRIARRTRAVVWQNIALALAVKGAVLALGGLGLANLWEALFADVGVALLAVLNSLRALRA